MIMLIMLCSYIMIYIRIYIDPVHGHVTLSEENGPAKAAEAARDHPSVACYRATTGVGRGGQGASCRAGSRCQ